MEKERKRLKGEAYSTGFSIQGYGIKVATRGLKETMSPEEFSKIDLGSLGQWHGAEHKLIWSIEKILEKGGALTLEGLKTASIERPRCLNQNKGIEEPSEDKLKEALWVGRKFLREFRLIRKRKKAENKFSPFLFPPESFSLGFCLRT